MHHCVVQRSKVTNTTTKSKGLLRLTLSPPFPRDSFRLGRNSQFRSGSTHGRRPSCRDRCWRFPLFPHFGWFFRHDLRQASCRSFEGLMATPRFCDSRFRHSRSFDLRQRTTAMSNTPTWIHYSAGFGMFLQRSTQRRDFPLVRSISEYGSGRC